MQIRDYKFRCLDEETKRSLLSFIDERLSITREKVVHLQDLYQWELKLIEQGRTTENSLSELRRMIEDAPYCPV